MKRARAEQLQATALLYLKKRNLTDSEETFHQHFKFEDSPLETASRILKSSKFTAFDTVAMASYCISEYFLAYNSFRTFINKTIKNKLYKGLNKLLFPVFVHAYLDLSVAGRSNDADEFYYLYSDDEQFKQIEGDLLKLKEVENQNNLTKLFAISQIRAKFCEVDVTAEEKELLLHFLHGEKNLLIMKLINERIRLDDSDCNSSEACIIDAIDKDQKDSFVLQSSEKLKEQKQSESNFTSDKGESPMIISPPSLSHAANSSSANFSSHTSEKSSFTPSIDAETLNKHLHRVKNSQPVVQNVHLFKFIDKRKVITHAGFSNNKKLISCGKEDSSVSLWSNCNFVQPIKHNQFVSFQSKCFDVSETSDKNNSFPDISHVTFGNEFTQDVYTRSTNDSVKRQQQLNENKVTCLRGHSGPVYSSSFTHDDRYLLTCSEDTTVRLWDMNDLRNKVIYNGHSSPIWCLSVSALSMYFATGSFDCTARLWCLDRTFPLRIYAGHRHSVETVRFHGNASYLATADHSVRLWDVNSGTTVRILTGHWAPITSLAFSPDGKWLASSGEDCRIRVWDIASGSLFKEIRSHNDTVYSLDFSPDGSMLVSCGADCSVYVWNVFSALPTTNIEGESHPHLVSHWSLKDSADKVIFSQFSGDIINCVAIV